MRSLLADRNFEDAVYDAMLSVPGCAARLDDMVVEAGNSWPLRNVWLGVSVESQQWADIRIPALLDTPAAVRFLSCEPLLGPVDLSPWLPNPTCPHCGHAETLHYFGPGDQYGRTVGCQAGDGSFDNPICGCRKLRGEGQHNPGDPYHNHGLHWVIVGGESGPGARPMNPDWARSLRDQCVAAGVAFHFKQHGEFVKEPGFADDYVRVGKKAAGRELDGRTWDEYPAAVR
jgi:protein gp37